MRPLPNFVFLLLLCLALFACSPSAQEQKASTTELANPIEPRSKQAYLDYFEAIKGKGCVSGQFIRWNYNASLEEIQETYETSGQWIGMLGADYYGNFQDSLPAPGCAYQLSNDVIDGYYAQHGLVNLSVHFVNPQSGGSAWDEEIDFDSLLVADSRVQRRFLRELDSVAVGLDHLQQAGVMVMFRPFHEMNGGWFWWGNQERYGELWRLTHNYLVQQKGLTKLLWCWSPSAGHTPFDRYYPGDEYVDLLGLDAYSSELVACCKDSYQAILAYDKPFGISEYGCVSGGAQEAEPFDYRTFLGWLKEDFPEAVYFLVWRDHWGFHGQEGVRELMNDPYLINKAEVMELTPR